MTECSQCGAGNSGDQRFCGACGSPLTAACRGCGYDNPGGFRFCGGCGAPLERAPEATQGTTEGERRWATVLFADLSGFTQHGEGLDPEDLRSMIDGCMTRMGAVVEMFGGSVLNVMGDGLLAVFGAPVAHEDDPERAVRAALEMQVCATEETDRFGGLALRVGVNTGEVMFAPVGPDRRQEPTVMGDTTNTASRLESAAPLGGVLVGDETYRASRRAIRYQQREPLQVKGKAEPVRSWLAVEPITDPADRPVSEMPIVGREGELGLLERIWERVAAEQVPHLATLLGPPGIGKSKVARGLMAWVSDRGGRTVVGRSLPYGERAGYGAFGQLVKSVADVHEAGDGDEAMAKLREAVATVVPNGRGQETADHLALLIGVGAEQPEAERKELFHSARRFIEGVARDSPTLVVFEDIQWADQSLLELIEWLLPRVQQTSVLFLTTARPELLDVYPSWGGGLTAYTALPLSPLSDADVAQLAARLLDGRVPDPGLAADHVARTSAGNPLFVEELAAWLAEHGGQPDGRLPTTVTAIVHARLDTVPREAKRVLFDASVIGDVFWRGVLARVVGDTALVDDALDELESRDLVRRESTSRLPGDEEYSFKHHLIRERAYAILPKATRRSRHRAVAAQLEAESGGGAVWAAILAHHWQAAGESERALEHLLLAADRAARGWAKGEAVKLYAQALELIPPEDESTRREVTRRRALARTMLMHAQLDAPQLGGGPAAGASQSDEPGKSSGETSPPIS